MPILATGQTGKSLSKFTPTWMGQLWALAELERPLRTRKCKPILTIHCGRL